MRYIAIIILAVFITTGCKNSQKTAQTTSPKSETIKTNPNCPDLLTNNKVFNNINADNYHISETRIEGNTLYFTCSYSGCPEDELVITWNGIMKKSYPGQVTLKVGSEQPSHCDALQSRNLCVNLNPLISSGKVMVYINGNKNSALFEPK